MAISGSVKLVSTLGHYIQIIVQHLIDYYFNLKLQNKWAVVFFLDLSMKN